MKKKKIKHKQHAIFVEPIDESKLPVLLQIEADMEYLEAGKNGRVKFPMFMRNS